LFLNRLLALRRIPLLLGGEVLNAVAVAALVRLCRRLEARSCSNSSQRVRGLSVAATSAAAAAAAEDSVFPQHARRAHKDAMTVQA
jgi:hypothetical protein